jgi:lysophospholipase L1-like esterase
MKLQANSKLLMIGDSITDCNRSRPVGEAVGDGLGIGYVGLVNAFLTATYPEQRIRVVNMGTSGNTVRDLAMRWPDDVVAMNPDWLSIMIGINDVWRQFDTRLLTEQHVSLDEYIETLETLIRAAAQPRLKGLVLMSPFFIEPNPADPMRAMMDRYGAALRQLAGRCGALFVDSQAAFENIMTELHPMALAGDRIHLNLTGHLILARAFLNAVGCKW